MTSPPPPSPDDLPSVVRAIQARIVAAVADAIRRWLRNGDDAGSLRHLLTALGRALADLRRVGDDAAASTVDAYRAGVARANRELPAGRRHQPSSSRPDRASDEVRTRIESAGLQVRRWAIQVHRDVLDQAARDVADGHLTRQRAAQQAWARILDRGATGFVDRAGRRWELASYVEMTVRTASAQARIQGHVDRLVEAGHEHVLVSGAPSTCPKCAPWAGKVLSLTRRGEHAVTLPHAVTGEPLRVDVAGSLAEAVEAGLFHPNCHHRLTAFIPGISRPDPATPAQLRRGEQRDRQRHMERQVRRWKLRETAAVDPAAARQARARVRQWQAALRTHTDRTGLRRKPERERVNTPR